MDRKEDDVIREGRWLLLELSALSGRLGEGLEETVRAAFENFSGEKFTRVERLVRTDATGLVYGIPGAASSPWRRAFPRNSGAGCRSYLQPSPFGRSFPRRALPR